MKQLWYVRGESQFSDHRPVYSLFSVQVDDEAKSGGVGTTASVTAAKSSGNSSSSSSSWGRVQAEELLLFTGTQSLYRFHKANIRKRDAKWKTKLWRRSFGSSSKCCGNETEEKTR
ncbi:hypothetical protein BHE74_00047532 [Ensete ventricosum]|nr:hypothetical protein BHE74_00047532 [Ensete ventricosum]